MMPNNTNIFQNSREFTRVLSGRLGSTNKRQDSFTVKIDVTEASDLIREDELGITDEDRESLLFACMWSIIERNPARISDLTFILCDDQPVDEWDRLAVRASNTMHHITQLADWISTNHYRVGRVDLFSDVLTLDLHKADDEDYLEETLHEPF